MEDFIKSIKAHLYERTTSPLFGTFFVSWAMWNYQFILVFFSSLPVDEKIDYISTFLYPCFYSYLLEGAIYPLITTIAFIFIYPWPAKFVYSFTRTRQKELQEVKQKIEDETPLTHKEYKKIRRDMTLLDIEYEKDLNRIKSENQRLKDTIQSMQNESKTKSINATANTNDKKVISDKKADASDEQLKLLELIANMDEAIENEIVKGSPTNKVKTEFNLGELVKLELISEHYDSYSGTTYSVTHEGRTLLVDKGVIK